jgi:hypothetical protein
MNSRIGIPGSMKMSLYPDRWIIPRGDFFSLSTFQFRFGYSVFILSCSGTFQFYTRSSDYRTSLSFASLRTIFLLSFLHTLYFYHCFLFGLAFSARDFHSMHSVPYIERIGAKYMPVLSSSAEANHYYNKTTVSLQTPGVMLPSLVQMFLHLLISVSSAGRRTPIFQCLGHGWYR